jgi:hypothetical protein
MWSAEKFNVPLDTHVSLFFFWPNWTMVNNYYRGSSTHTHTNTGLIAIGCDVIDTQGQQLDSTASDRIIIRLGKNTCIKLHRYQDFLLSLAPNVLDRKAR